MLLAVTMSDYSVGAEIARFWFDQVHFNHEIHRKQARTPTWRSSLIETGESHAFRPKNVEKIRKKG